MYVSACCRLLEEDKTADFDARTATTVEISIYIETIYVVATCRVTASQSMIEMLIHGFHINSIGLWYTDGMH